MKKYFICLGLLCGLTAQVYANFTLQQLQVNYQATPLGTDLPQPQFSWQMRASDQRKGYAQTAYQIVVMDEKRRVVWDTKKISSEFSHAIQYAGAPLSATTRYTWKLTVWDRFGTSASSSSWFETGLMDASIKAWSGAQWIGGGDDDLVLYAPALSVYRFQYGIQLDQAAGSTKAAFVFGANDPRLMNKNLNLMGQERKKNESYFAVELDIAALNDAKGGAKLNLYRVGYTNNDQSDVPFKALEIPATIINANNKYDKHQVYADCVFGQCEFYVNGTDATHRLKEAATDGGGQGFGARGINLNPAGRGGDYISYPMLAEIGFKTGANQSAYFSDLQIKNFRHPSNTLFTEPLNIGAYNGIFKASPIQIENGRYRVAGNQLITADPSKNAAPMLRAVFNVAAKNIHKARLYVTARGIYEIHLNGKRVGNEYFNPGATQYNRTHMYQTYDVTAVLQNGKPNAIGAWLGEGWWSGNSTFSGDNWNFFGDRQSLLAKLTITYADGTEQTVTTNDKDWKLFTDGPIRNGSFFQGEVYDANKEAAIQDWATAEYKDTDWKRAVAVPLAGTTYEGNAGLMTRQLSMAYDNVKLVGQLGENAMVVKTLTAQKVEEVRPKVFVYDMGQNMVGVPQIPIKGGKKGQVVTLRYAEMKYPNLPDYKGNEGMVMMENIRAALTTDTYVLKGGDEIIQPRFTFHGYRYLEITGIDQSIPAPQIKGLVLSSVSELASNYETSNPLVNKLWQNITWSLRSNFLSIPTDTPARNERLGWSGDIMVFSRSSTYLANANLFLRRHLIAMRDTQSDEGRFADVAPTGFGFGGTLWGSAGIIVAWEAYRQFGDRQLLAEHYDAMKRYIRFLESKVDKNTGILNEGPLGDWLSPEGNKNDNTLFWMAYFAYDFEIVSKAAAILGKTEEAKQFQQRSQEIKKAFNEIYVDKISHRTVKSGVRTGFMGPPNQQQGPPQAEKGQLIDTQASYAIPLALGTFNEENKTYAIQFLQETVQRENKDDDKVERPEYSLMTGFIGTASISEALSAHGNDALAYRLLVQKEYPSWLYPVVNGATSIWERLNSYTIENGFGGNNSMNSFNHYSFGAVAAWMYNYSLGIQRHPEKTGFKEFILRPTPDPNYQITFAKGHYDSMYGRIASEWQVEGNKLMYKTTVPANTTAKLYLPAKSVSQIFESGKSITKWQGVEINGDRVLIPLVSGSYSFEVRN